MKQLILILFCVSVAFGQTVRVTWGAGTEPDLAGYNIYQGTESRAYNKVLSTAETRAEIPVIPDQPNYFAVTSFDTAGNESDFSNEVNWNVYTAYFDTVYILDSRLYYSVKSNIPDSSEFEIQIQINGAIVSVTSEPENYVELPTLNDWETVNLSLSTFNSQTAVSPKQAEIVAPISGDFDNDGKIGVKDQQAFDKSYGSKTGWAKYQLQFDFDRNGQISLRDIREFSKRYGKVKKND